MIDKNQDEIVGKYQPKKKQNIKIYNFIEKNLSESGRELFKSCSNFNLFITTQDKSTKKRLKGYDCKNRFCPICAWRKARKDAMKISVMMEAIKVDENKDFLFLTLTTPNIKADSVKTEIDRFNKAFNKLFKRRNIERSIKGYIRKLEMTYDKERFITKEMYKRKQAYYKKRNLKVGDNNPTYDTYNPHFHVLLCVDKSYFKKKELYIKQEEWLEMWRDVTDLPEITQVSIQKVNLIRGGNAVAEIAKYSAKDYEMAVSEDVFDVFYSALKGRQLIVYGGLLKEYAKKYETGELDKHMGKDQNEYFYKLIATWNADLLKFNQEYKELSPEEFEEYNGKLIDEIEVE
ncbi:MULTISPECIES: protein rep [unclassified Niallia]|uniref:protein rep n=1 Tax=unclassified Niallia TaxID=2837522 RepID=UPI0013D21FA7